MFGSVLLRREGVRGFGFGIGCSGVIQMTQDGHRQVRIGRIGVGTVTVVTLAVHTIIHFVNDSFGADRSFSDADTHPSLRFIFCRRSFLMLPDRSCDDLRRHDILRLCREGRCSGMDTS